MTTSFIPYRRQTYSAEEMKKRSRDFYKWMDRRRTVRHISDKPVPQQVMKDIIKTASTAPSGAHKQPWTFCLVSDHKLKKQIREAAEAEEYKNYNERMSEQWKRDLEPLGTDWHKPFLTKAPYLIAVFKQPYELKEGEKYPNYYVDQSVGLACGFLLTAIHNAGLVALTHTPSPMNFLSELLERPKNERPYLLIPVGYPSADAEVPDLQRKSLEEVMVSYDETQ